MRALRTRDFVYIRNFAADRWPMGSPGAATGPEIFNSAMWETNTFAGYADMDASPTKAWLVAHRDDSKWKWHYDFAFAKRPAEELYDLRKDPDQINNVAAVPAYAATKSELSRRLIKTLTDAKDPRVTGDGQTFELPPFTDLEKAPDAVAPKKGGKKKAGAPAAK
jgi:uncharacterized sulfatase